MKIALLLIALLLVGCSGSGIPSLSDKLRGDVEAFRSLPAATQVVLLLDTPIMFIAVGILFVGIGVLVHREEKK